MISIRRLRAVLVFATLSSVGWAIIGSIVGLGFSVLNETSITVTSLLVPAAIFAAIGFAAGTAWSVAVAVLPRKDDRALTPVVAALAGAVAGMLVMTGLFVSTGFPADLVFPFAMTAGIGGAVGLLIQRTASRGRLIEGGSSAALGEGADTGAFPRLPPRG